MASLLEAYSKRIAVAEKYFQNKHNGEKLTENKKLVVAKVLENTNRALNEAFNNSIGTNRSDLGMFKKFSLNLTTVALPNLIANDLVIVYPMSSMSGYISYVQYTAGSDKGATTQGKILNDPFRLGDVDANYTSATVVDEGKATATQQDFPMKWTPVIKGTVVMKTGELTYYDDGNGKLVQPAAGSTVSRVINGDGSVTISFTGNTPTQVGTVTYDGADAKISLTTGLNEGADFKVSYAYNNVVIPQNDLPILNAQIKALPLIAKARRIAIYYSQIAAFQAKTDYGMDLGQQLAEKAVGELSYEIDTEITNMLVDNAAESDLLKFNKALPMGVSKAEHYEGFNEIVGIADQLLYDRTKRYSATYMLIASDVKPILPFLRDWKAAPAGTINGPYFAGTLGHLKVFVTPNIKAGTFVLGVNGDDMMSSAAVYAPYMAIVPTQLLGYADGGMSQGWSTLYDLQMLNKDLLVKGTVVNDPATANAQVINTKSNT